MTYSMDVDTSEMGRLGQQLGSSGDPLNETAADLPEPPQAGPCTEVIAAALASMSQSAGDLADGLGMAGLQVHRSADEDEAAEVTNTDSMGASGPYGSGS